MNSMMRRTLYCLALAMALIPIGASGQEVLGIPTNRPNLDIMICAHRGVLAKAPENTLPAIVAAIELGYSYVEIDVRYTRDNVPVLMHDSWVTRTTGAIGPVRWYSLKALKMLDAGWTRGPRFIGTRVPTADEALGLMSGNVKLYLDQKAPPTPEFIELVKRHGFFPHNMVVVGGGANIKEFLRHEPGAPVMPGLKDTTVEALLAEFPSMVAVNTRCQWLTAEMVDDAHAHGLMVFTNVLALPRSVEKKCMRVPIELGADVIQMDNVDLYLEVIQEMRMEAGEEGY